jgi:hypothetical protein
MSDSRLRSAPGNRLEVRQRLPYVTSQLAAVRTAVHDQRHEVRVRWSEAAGLHAEGRRSQRHTCRCTVWKYHAMRAPRDPYPDALARIIDARIEGDEETALAEMTRYRFLLPERKTVRWPAISVIATVYARDHYHCRYCGERVILTAVMRLVSRLYPGLFPYHPNWKADSTHPAFISRSATLDHVQPITGGGDPTDPANMVTACWGCNRRKGDLRLDEIGWALLEPSDSSWRGLTELFRPLWDAVGRPPLSEDEHAWMRAVAAAKRPDPPPHRADQRP